MNFIKAPILLKDEALQQRINEKLETLRCYEKDIPGVLIIHSIKDSTVVYMSQRGLDILGITLDEVRNLKTEYYDRFFNPDDASDYVPKILGLLERNNDDEIVSYFQQVRPSPDHDWTWYSSSTKVFMRDENNQPLLTITIAIPIDAQHFWNKKVERLLKENEFLRSKKKVFDSLTRREREILKLLATGLSSVEIARKLFISEATVNTHRRNLRLKLNIETALDLVRFAQAFDLV